MTFNLFRSVGALQRMSYHYSNYHSNDDNSNYRSNNNAIIIWNNQIFKDYTGNTSLALSVREECYLTYVAPVGYIFISYRDLEK